MQDRSAARLRRVDIGVGAADAITLSVTSAGEGPVVLMLHGFPDIGYSWRHQIGPLVEAGHRVLAPDQRGYGWSDAPESIEAYGIFDLVGDAVGLLDADNIEDCVLVGHDWGAIVAWHIALMRPDRLRGLVLMSVPFQPRMNRSILDHIRSTDPDGPFDYMLAFQEEGVAEAMMDPDPIGTLRAVYGDEMPAEEMENYGRAFARSGFRGGINWYRNLDRNWAETRPWHGAKLSMPAAFIGGADDFVVARADGKLGAAVSNMSEHCMDFRGTTIVDGAGHWVHQEEPAEVNAVLLDFIRGLDDSGVGGVDDRGVRGVDDRDG